jgi:WD40 repeat protein
MGSELLKFSKSSDNNSQNVASSVSFSPDGKMIAASDYNGFIGIWNVKGWGRIKEFHAHEDQIYSVTFSPDSKVIASASREIEKRLALWNLKGENMAVLKGHTQAVNQVKFQPQNKNEPYVIASSSDDSTVRLWSFSSNKNNSSKEQAVGKLLINTCLSMSDYLQTNKNIFPRERSHICDDIKTRYRPYKN